MSRTTFVVVLVLALVAGVSITLYLAEWKELELPGQPSEESIRNPYLAAEHFLGRFDVPMHRKQSLSLLDDLPSTNSVIVVGSSLRTVSDRRLDALLDWVDRGGRLVTLARDFYSQGRDSTVDPILEAIGVGLFDAEDLDHDEDEVDEDSMTDAEKMAELLEELEIAREVCREDERLTEITFEGERIIHRIAMTEDRYLDTLDATWYPGAVNGVGPQLIAASYGQGFVYAVTTLSFWRNAAISCHDHAHMLRWLGEGRDGVWMLFDTDMPNIAEILWQRYALALSLLGALILLWVWRGGGNRSVEVQEPAPRRSVLEHVRGMARFQWQQGEHDRLLAELRTSALAGIELDPLRREEWLKGMSRATGETVEHLQWALEADLGRDAQAVKRAVRILIRIFEHK